MWARRCGAPPTWPSRVKVFLFSIGTGAAGLTIYTFMASINLGYLDLSRPSKNPVLCLHHWPLHNELGSWFDQQSWGTWFEYQKTGANYYLNGQVRCKVPGPEANATCASITVPLHKLMGNLGPPLELEPEPRQWQTTFDLLHLFSSRDVLGIYAYLFLLLSICLWLAITIHDHALLHATNKDYILDILGLMSYFPRLKMAVTYLMGWRILRRLLSCRSRWFAAASIPTAVILAPVLLVWRLLIFMFVVCPLASLIFVCYPIRTSRIWIFLLCIASTVYGVCLTAQMSYSLGSSEYRPRYAVTWQVGSCFCGCVYPVSQTTCARLLMIGLFASIKASVIAFRTLKGLRRYNWANLMSVTFPVPVNAYSVEWTQPDGKPISNRKVGDPVQSELAFDPFALMDEQPQSANSHVTLRPTFVLSREVDKRSGTTKLKRISKRRLLGPNLPNLHNLQVEEEEIEQVGCCGFPFRTGGIRGRLELQETPASWKDSFHDRQDDSVHGRGSASSGSREESPRSPLSLPRIGLPFKGAVLGKASTHNGSEPTGMPERSLGTGFPLVGPHGMGAVVKASTSTEPEASAPEEPETTLMLERLAPDDCGSEAVVQLHTNWFPVVAHHRNPESV